MAFIEASLPPIRVWVRDGFFYNDPDGEEYKDKYTQAVLISVRCNEGSAALFQVLTEHGMMRDKLPISAICWEKPEDYGIWKKYPFHYLQLWDCFSKVFSIVTLNYIYNAKVHVLLKNKEVVSGHYIFTIQWGGNENTGTDLTLAEDPGEHKSHHFIMLDNGLFAIQPNNRIIKWIDPSFTTKEFKGKPWKVNTQEFCCEHHERWLTEDSDNYYYDAEGVDKTYTLEEVQEILHKDQTPEYVLEWQEAKKEKEIMKKMKKKLAAPKPKKGAKKKTTYLYGGPAK